MSGGKGTFRKHPCILSPIRRAGAQVFICRSQHLCYVGPTPPHAPECPLVSVVPLLVFAVSQCMLPYPCPEVFWAEGGRNENVTLKSEAFLLKMFLWDGQTADSTVELTDSGTISISSVPGCL